MVEPVRRAGLATGRRDAVGRLLPARLSPPGRPGVRGVPRPPRAGGRLRHLLPPAAVGSGSSRLDRGRRGLRALWHVGLVRTRDRQSRGVPPAGASGRRAGPGIGLVPLAATAGDSWRWHWASPSCPDFQRSPTSTAFSSLVWAAVRLFSLPARPASDGGQAGPGGSRRRSSSVRPRWWPSSTTSPTPTSDPTPAPSPTAPCPIQSLAQTILPYGFGPIFGLQSQGRRRF